MRQKVTALILAGLMIIIAGCGTSASGAKQPSGSGQGITAGGTTDSDSAASSGTATAGAAFGGADNGDAADAANVWHMERAGVTITPPDSYTAYPEQVYVEPGAEELDDGIVMAGITFYPNSWDELVGMDEEAFTKMLSNTVSLLTVIGLDGGRGEAEFNEWLQKRGASITVQLEKLGAAGDFTFYEMRYDADAPAFDAGIQKIYDELAADTGKARKSLVFSEPAGYAKAKAGSTVRFETTDLEGNPVKSEDIFGKNKITMLNLWASWCGPCVNEMPELEKLNRAFREKGCEIVGILMDGDEAPGLEDGKAVVKETGVTYTMLIVPENINDLFPVQAYPTTYFVDSDGKVAGEPIIGALVDRYETRLDELLAQMH